MDDRGGMLSVKKFIECEDEIGKAVGEGHFSKDGDYLHVVTSDIEVAKFFEKRDDEDSKVVKLVFKRERGGTTTFPVSFTIIEFYKSHDGEWNIKMKENITKIKS